ncbi:MAG: hypothetical protein EBR49_19130, partial [Betaproteobacteria bacterium]|nr:hypothetical protein [Betaproteobacteria bacterium]
MNPLLAALAANPLYGEALDPERKLRGPQSAGNTLTTNVQPGQAIGTNDPVSQYSLRAADLYRQGSDLANAAPDVEGFKQMARKRSEEGSGALLTALAAQFAGPGYENIAHQSIKRADASRDPIKVGNAGYVTPEGEFVSDPYYQREKRAEFLLQQAKGYEQMAQNARTQQERAEALKAQNEVQNELRRMQIENQRFAMQNQAQQTAFLNNWRMQQAADAKDRRDQAQADARDKATSAGATNLSKRLEDLTNIYSSVKQLNDRLTTYAAKGQKSIPGVGYGTDMSLLGLDVSGPFLGEEGRENRAMVKSVANELLRMASGQAVTLNEAQRKQLELM